MWSMWSWIICVVFLCSSLYRFVNFSRMLCAFVGPFLPFVRVVLICFPPVFFLCQLCLYSTHLILRFCYETTWKISYFCCLLDLVFDLMSLDLVLGLWPQTSNPCYDFSRIKVFNYTLVEWFGPLMTLKKAIIDLTSYSKRLRHLKKSWMIIHMFKT